jgi:hypothetical protein
MSTPMSLALRLSGVGLVRDEVTIRDAVDWNVSPVRQRAVADLDPRRRAAAGWLMGVRFTGPDTAAMAAGHLAGGHKGGHDTGTRAIRTVGVGLGRGGRRAIRGVAAAGCGQSARPAASRAAPPPRPPQSNPTRHRQRRSADRHRRGSPGRSTPRRSLTRSHISATPRERIGPIGGRADGVPENGPISCLVAVDELAAVPLQLVATTGSSG